jgi:hypothetical protein
MAEALFDGDAAALMSPGLRWPNCSPGLLPGRLASLSATPSRLPLAADLWRWASLDPIVSLIYDVTSTAPFLARSRGTNSGGFLGGG